MQHSIGTGRGSRRSRRAGARTSVPARFASTSKSELAHSVRYAPVLGTVQRRCYLEQFPQPNWILGVNPAPAELRARRTSSFPSSVRIVDVFGAGSHEGQQHLGLAAVLPTRHQRPAVALAEGARVKQDVPLTQQSKPVLGHGLPGPSTPADHLVTQGTTPSHLAGRRSSVAGAGQRRRRTQRACPA